MAVYSWLSSIQSSSLEEVFNVSFKQLGLEIRKEVSSDKEIYAEATPHGDMSIPLVKVILTWTCFEQKKLQIEVRSSEAMLSSFTRCEDIAKALKTIAPPL